MARVANIGVRVGADISGLQRGMGQAETTLDRFRRSTRQVERSLSSLKAGFLATSAAATALGGALAVVTTNAASNAKEIENLSRIAGVSTTEFQEMAFAAKSVGIEQDKLGDILKDVNDKVGDFLTTGAGGMVDFFEQVAPKVGITADAFRDLNSREALQLYIDSLEAANLSQAEMTFHLEAIASDATALLPLFSKNAKGLKEMAGEANELGVVLTELEIEKLSDAAESINKLKASFSALGNELALALTPQITETVDKITAFFAEINKQKSEEIFVNEVMGPLNQTRQLIEETTKAIEIMESRLGGVGGSLDLSVIADLNQKRQDLEKYNEQLAILEARRDELLGIQRPLQDSILNDETESQLEQAIVKVEELKASIKQLGEIPTVEFAADFAQNIGNSDEMIKAIAQREFMLEEMTSASVLALQREYDEREKEIKRLFGRESDLLIGLEQERAAAIASVKAQEQAAAMRMTTGFFSDLTTILTKEGKQQFEIQKKLSIAGAIVDGYESAVSAYAAGMKAGGPIGPAVGAAYAAASLAATGAQIAKISRTQYGTTTQDNSVSGGGVPATQAPQLQQNVNVTLEGDSFTSGQVSSLIQSINNEIENGATINLSASTGL